ncbi:hypothetical protein GCM10023196_041060 [Actinoallomurus vinaceus]|uniref:Uncharacterized protein n=1 Tax=Actinoallomurus vinaceus TaxID=1080074 RepID=A0ABP8UE36_9ACTN
MLDFVVRLLVPAGVLTALVYYFGYTRAKAQYEYFGVDLGSIGFSTKDYLVRAAGPLFTPLAAVLVAGVFVLIAHHVLVFVLDRLSLRWRRVIWGVLAGGAFVTLIVGAIGLYNVHWPITGPLFSPVALGAGALLLEYATENALIRGAVPDGLAAVLASTRALRRGLLVAVALVAAFWATAGVADRQGRSHARAIEVSLITQPQAIVYSRERLRIEGRRGVQMSRLGGSTDSAYAFRYDGLRTLLHTPGRWFLLPTDWTPDNRQPVILLPDSRNDIRVEVAPPS